MRNAAKEKARIKELMSEAHVKATFSKYYAVTEMTAEESRQVDEYARRLNQRVFCQRPRVVVEVRS